MFENGLLILSTSAVKLLSISKVLKNCSDYVGNVLFVHLVHITDYLNLSSPGASSNVRAVCSSKFILNFINEFYLHSAYNFKSLDVKFIVSNISDASHVKLTPNSLSSSIQVLLTDINEQYHTSLVDYANNLFSKPFSSSNKILVKSLSDVYSSKSEIQNESESDQPNIQSKFKHVCLGGTFDRLHTGHKVLLNQAVSISNNQLTIGVTDGEMNQAKILSELIEPTSHRISVVKSFLSDIQSNLQYNVIPINDIYGPSTKDPTIDCLVVSEETIKGGEMVNEERIKKGFTKLNIEIVKLVNDESNTNEPNDETKISSSTARKHLLGTLLKVPQKKDHLPKIPYIIGLTGGIASGKTSVSKRFEALGAGIINCDLLGHEAYLPGSQTLTDIVNAFGDDVLDANGYIDRRKLGSIVFSDKDKLNKLNEIVWPAIQKLITKYVDALLKEGKVVIILDAAVLIEAGWDANVHEVWTAIIPRSEAITRMMERNKIDAKQAEERLNSQLTNQERVQKSNVIFCTLWDYSYTQKQVEKAWILLQDRIK